MDQAMDDAARIVAHCRLDRNVGILSLVLLLGLFGTFLINTLLSTNMHWAHVSVLSGMMGLTVFAILILWLRTCFIGLKVAIGITQLSPYAVLITTGVVPMCIFTATSVAHLFLMDHLKFVPHGLRITAGACHVICLIMAAIFDDVGLLNLFHKVLGTGHLHLNPKCTAVTVGLLFPFAQMAVLYVAQGALATRYQSALGLAEEKAVVASHAIDRILQVVSHELQTPLHIIAGFAECVRKERHESGSSTNWGTQIGTHCKELLVCTVVSGVVIGRLRQRYRLWGVGVVRLACLRPHAPQNAVRAPLPNPPAWLCGTNPMTLTKPEPTGLVSLRTKHKS